MNRNAARIVILVVVLSAPTVAHAHLVNSGLGPFYDGALHVFMSPMDIVRLLAVYLLAGMQGPSAARMAAVVAPIAWLAAATLAVSLRPTGAVPVIDAAGLILLGAVVALDIKLPWFVTAAIVAGIAGLLGFQNGTELVSDNGSWAALIGAVLVVLVLALLALSFIVSARTFATRVACRVLGSWAAATGLLSLGWIFAANR